MILCDRQILEAIENKAIQITPFERRFLGTNSYDIHLSPLLLRLTENVLDMRQPTKVEEVPIPKDGYVLRPNELYLASSIEYTESHLHLPIINGKSSLGRLGLDIHITAGWGDVGFCGFWTLELRVVKPLRVYAGAPIGQIMWQTAGEPETHYGAKKSANYAGQKAEPQPSKLWKDFESKMLDIY